MSGASKNAIENTNGAQAPAKSRRRWLRYSLRTLLILMTLCAVLLGIFGQRIRGIQSERAVIAWIEEQGGSVTFHEPRRWSLDKWIGTSVDSVSLDDTQITDISPLAELDNLTTLYLDSTQVTDLSPLAKLNNLQYLYLDSTQVTDLSPIANLENLFMISLINTPVSEDELQSFQKAMQGCLIALPSSIIL